MRASETRLKFCAVATIINWFKIFLNSINGRINYLENIVNNYAENYKLITSSNVNVLFSKTNHGQNYLNILFNGTLDSSIQDYVFTYTFKNTEPYDYVLGSIFFKTRHFQQNNTLK